MLTQSNKKTVDTTNAISVDVETNDKLKELTGPRLSLLLDQVLNDSTYRNNARCFQKAIAEINGVSKAAHLLERSFGLTRKPIYEAASDA